ncbi:MAG: polysaccharide biosynthesis C-terminal domain-containing protein, partial [Candidatus Hinthialibacter sp.]
ITPISIGAISFIIYARIDVLMLQWMGFEHTIAIYGCAFRPIGFLSMFVAAFYHAFAPTVSKMIHRDPRRAFYVSAKAGALFSLAGLAAALFIFVLRHEITSLLYPEIFESTADALGPLAWSLPIIFGGNAVGFFLVNQGKKGATYYMIVNLIGVVVNILGNLLVIPSHNFVGAAWMTVATDAITTLLMILFALLIIKQKPRSSSAVIASR